MAEKIKTRLYIISIITLMVISVDFICFSLSFENQLELRCECPDFSKHTPHSHTHKFEDEVFHTSLQTSQIKPEAKNDFLVNHNFPFKDTYFSKVWQPPKAS